MIVPSNRRQSRPEGRQFLANVNDIVPDDSVASERQAIVEFLATAPEGGTIPASRPYLPGRDEVFIKTWYVGASVSRLVRQPGPRDNLEDAREAIHVGRKAGYSDADIAAYLRRNYAIEGT